MTAPVVVVTGAAGGIGSATVEVLATRGYTVAALDRSELRTTTPTVSHHRLDLTAENEVEAAVDEIASRYGRIDALVNCAAVLECYAVDDTPLDVWQRIFAVNVTGTFLMARACIPHLRRAGGGAIVNLSSVHALASIPRTAAYAASKGAILSLSRQMAVEYADDDIRVNALVVGSVDTQMSTAHGAAMARDGVEVSEPAGRLGRMAQPTEIARTIAFLLSDDASFVTGAAFQVDGGLLDRLM